MIASKIWSKVLFAACVLLIILLSIKQLREPDLWWQIRTGEWIIANGEVPKQDVFSFTHQGTPWINIKWGFEVMAAAVTGAFGADSVLLLQVVFSVLLSLVLYKTAAMYVENDTKFSLVISITFLLVLPAIEYRMIGRPEMITHFFTALFLLLLLNHQRSPNRQIYWLVPLQLLWANLHEAFGIGIVLIGLFALTDVLNFVYQKIKQKSITIEFPKVIILVLIASLAAICINPQGVKLLLRPIEIFGQVYENKFTTELLDFTSPDFWQWQVYLTYGLLLFSLVSLLVMSRMKKIADWLSSFYRQMSLGYWLVLLAFVYLSTTAFRNVVFLPIVSFPLLIISLNFWLGKITQVKTTQYIRLGLLGVFILSYLVVITNKYYELTGSRDKYGLAVPTNYNPVGAANFIQKNSLQGPCFSDYLTSSYLLWRLQPEFKTFIDLRDLDVFPSSFFNQFAEAVTLPSSFEQLDSVYRFNYIVLYRPQFPQLHFHLFNQSNFKLAYADAVACVYTRKKDTTENSALLFSSVPDNTAGRIAKIFTHFFNPFYTWTNKAKVNTNFEAASFANVVGQPNAAEQFALKAIAENQDNYKGQQLLGEVYYNKALRATTVDEKLQWLFQAQSLYQQSLLAQPDYAVAHLGLGAVYFQQENYKLALSQFDDAINYDSKNLNAHLFAAECAKFFINQKGVNNADDVKLAIGYYEKANRLNPNNPTIMMNLGVLYFKINDCEKSKKYLLPIDGFVGFQPAEQKNIATCLLQCGYTK